MIYIKEGLALWGLLLVIWALTEFAQVIR